MFVVAAATPETCGVVSGSSPTPGFHSNPLVPVVIGSTDNGFGCRCFPCPSFFYLILLVCWLLVRAPSILLSSPLECRYFGFSYFQAWPSEVSSMASSSMGVISSAISSPIGLNLVRGFQKILCFQIPWCSTVTKCRGVTTSAFLDGEEVLRTPTITIDRNNYYQLLH